MKRGRSIDLEPCPTKTSTIEDPLASVPVKRTITTRVPDSENSDNDLKDVACIVFSQRSERDCSSIYLVDVTKQKLRGFVEMDGEIYPFGMAYVVYKRMLFMFGGMILADPDMVGCNNAYVLDLFEVAKSSDTGNDKQKPPVIELPGMISGKCVPRAAIVGDKICVFDKILGHKPADCSFELFDPEQKTWAKIPDPFHFERGHFVGEFFVKDDKLVVSFRDIGIYVLNFGESSPFWVHHKKIYGVRFLPNTTRGVKIGDIVLNLFEANDLADDHEGFVWSIKTTCSGVTAEKDFEVVEENNGPICLVGPTTVCSVKSVLVHKRSGSDPEAVSDPKSSLGMGLRKCNSTEDGFKLLVNVYDVDLAVRPIQLKVVRSFMVPLKLDAGFLRVFFR